MSKVRFGKRQHDEEDLMTMLCLLEENQALEQIAKTSYMSHTWIIFLAITHFGSLSLDEQWALAEKYLTKLASRQTQEPGASTYQGKCGGS